MDGTCSTHRRGEKFIQNFGLETMKGRELGRRRRIWENNIKMDRREIV